MNGDLWMQLLLHCIRDDGRGRASQDTPYSNHTRIACLSGRLVTDKREALDRVHLP
jgi:hypothetical protein